MKIKPLQTINPALFKDMEKVLGTYIPNEIKEFIDYYMTNVLDEQIVFSSRIDPISYDYYSFIKYKGNKVADSDLKFYKELKGKGLIPIMYVDKSRYINPNGEYFPLLYVILLCIDKYMKLYAVHYNLYDIQTEKIVSSNKLYIRRTGVYRISKILKFNKKTVDIDFINDTINAGRNVYQDNLEI